MGRWGAGNFDSDEGLDVIGLLMESLVKNIVFELAAEVNTNQPQSYSTYAMQNVDVLLSLSEYMHGVALHITPKMVQHWRQTLLQILEEDASKPDDYKTRQRQIISESLDRLEHYAQ